MDRNKIRPTNLYSLVTEEIASERGAFGRYRRHGSFFFNVNLAMESSMDEPSPGYIHPTNATWFGTGKG